MYGTRPVLDAVDRFAAAEGISASTVANRAMSNGTFIRRLREGKVTLRRIDQLIRYLAEHWPGELAWPDDLPWPEGVSRPAPPREHEAA